MDKMQADISNEQREEIEDLRTQIEEQKSINKELDDDNDNLWYMLIALLLTLYVGVTINYFGGLAELIEGL